MRGDLHPALAGALGAHPPRRIDSPGARAAAVLVPVVGASDPALILTQRTEHLPSHKGQIAFPGGSIDRDETPVQAALREAHEEIGLDPGEVEIVGELDTFPTFVSGFVITPVVGYVARLPELRPNPAEVAAVLTVPLADLTDEIRREPGFVHAGRSYPTEAWVWRGHVIWGVTARILRLLLMRLAAAGLVSHPGPDPLAAGAGGPA